MHACRLTARAGLLAVAFGVLASYGPARLGAQPAETPVATERNAWPFVVDTVTPGTRQPEWTGAGPLLFGRMDPDGEGRIGGLRPIWVQRTDAQGQFRAGFFLYPVFSYRVDEHTYQWNVFELIRRTGPRGNAPAGLSRYETVHDFEIWPFFFSRQTDDPELSYRALFPIAGKLQNKLGFERASWVLWPLYFQTEKRGVRTTAVPWPIVRVTRGAAHGFGLWPLFEYRDAPGRWRQETYLWPLGYNNTTYPAANAPAGTPPKRDVGALPLYARHTGPGYVDQNFLWPFFGYTDRTQPTRFHETRYFWPFLVQGRGDNRYINRWGPFYTHSVVQGYDKTWYAWPVVRHAEWTDRGLDVSKTQVLYFLYWNETQRHVGQPNGRAASLTHLWPLFSNWDDGAGRRQFQFFSPFDVFFPGNVKVQAAWSPLFAIARYDRPSPGESRTSLLWNAITWRRDDRRREREVHVGPLFSLVARGAAERVAIGNGLVSFRRDADAGWRVRWFDFHPADAATNRAGRDAPHDNARFAAPTPASTVR